MKFLVAILTYISLSASAFSAEPQRYSIYICNWSAGSKDVAIAYHAPGQNRVFSSGWWSMTAFQCVHANHEAFHTHLQYYIAVKTNQGIAQPKPAATVKACLDKANAFNDFTAMTCQQNNGVNPNIGLYLFHAIDPKLRVDL